MSDIEIPRTQWQEFCDHFSHQHHGWLVGISQLDTDDVEQEVPKHTPVRMYDGTRPLQEVREGNNKNHAEVMVTVGEGVDETSFLIEDAVALYQRRIGEAHQGLRVDSDNGTTTLVEFRTAAEPEALDGLAESEF